MESRKRIVGRHNDNDNCNNSHNGVHSFDKLHSKNCEQKKMESSIVPAMHMHACTPEYFGAASISNFVRKLRVICSFRKSEIAGLPLNLIAGRIFSTYTDTQNRPGLSGRLFDPSEPVGDVLQKYMCYVYIRYKARLSYTSG